MTSIQLRIAVLADVSAINAVVCAARQKMYDIGNRQWNDNYPGPANFEQDINNGYAWVAELQSDGDKNCNSKIVGYAAFTTEQTNDYKLGGCNVDIPSIVPHRIAVDPNCQGKGIAMKLLLHGEVLARQRGFQYIRIDTHKNNAAMLHLIENKLKYTYKGIITLSGRGPPPELRNWYEKELI